MIVVAPCFFADYVFTAADTSRTKAGKKKRSSFPLQ